MNRAPHSEETKRRISLSCIGKKITSPNSTDEKRLKNRIKMQKWRAKNPDRNKHNTRLWRQKNKAKIRAYNLRNRLGVTTEQWAEAYAKQNGRCCICKELKNLVTDHCHATGVFRGLLCIKCNTNLGVLEMINNNHIWTKEATEYLSLVR